MEQGTYNNFAIDKVIYGQPAAATVAAEARRLGASRVFLMVSEPLATETPLAAQFEAALGSLHVATWTDMPQHTPLDAVLRAADKAREVKPDLVVTFGGGSVTDGGKMLRLALKHDIRTLDGFEPFIIRVGPDGKREPNDYEGPELAQIAVPTTLGGGDFNPSVGGTDPRTKLKEIYIQRLLTPKVAILDPAVTLPTPEWLFLSTGLRALDHAIGTVCSPAAGPRSWLEAMEAIRRLSRCLPVIKAQPENLDARMDALLAMWLSMERNRFGLPMGASHAIGHVLGGTLDVPHGYCSCVMLPSVLRWNASVNADRQALISEAFGKPGQAAADIVADLIAELGLPQRLADVGIDERQFDLIAEASMLDYCVYTNPRKISGEADIIEILRLAA